MRLTPSQTRVFCKSDCTVKPNLADFYINTGSCYLASVVFLPLGLPDTDPFWTDKPETWTAVKIWNGEDVAADHAMDLH